MKPFVATGGKRWQIEPVGFVNSVVWEICRGIDPAPASVRVFCVSVGGLGVVGDAVSEVDA
jgi:hypothetical protein